MFRFIFCLSLSLSVCHAGSDFFTVNSTGDEGDEHPGDGICQTDQTNCTLRAAIEESNAFTNSLSTISINSFGPGSTVILVGPDLPQCEKTVHLQRFGSAPLAIEGNGNAGLEFLANSNLIGGSTDQGFSINGFANGIVLNGGSFSGISDILIGFDALSNAVGNVGVGILIEDSSSNTIGGNTDGSGNRHGDVIALCDSDGVLITGTSSNNTLRNLLIGVDPTGLEAFGNQGHGVHIVNTSGNSISGFSTNNFTVISGNVGHGVFIEGANAKGNGVGDARIGVNFDGTAKIANGGDGVQILDGAKNNISTRVLISGNNGNGVTIDGSSATNNSIGASLIGTDINTNALANGGRGVLIRNGASQNQVANGALIAFNNGPGVAITTGANNLIAFPSIFGNGGPAIDLGDDGSTANDALDTDTGPNNFQNYPVITAVIATGTGTVFQGTMDSRPNTSYTIYHYANGTDCGNGDARTMIPFGGQGINTDANGHGTYSFFNTNLIAEGTMISVYALDNSTYPYNVSEFSPCVAVTTGGGSSADLSVNVVDAPDPVTVGSNITYTITVHNGGPATATGVMLTNTLSSSVSYVTGSANFSHAGSLVTCNVGNVPSGASSNFFITVSTISTGTITNKATVHGNESDPSASNNTANTPTTVANGATFIQFCVQKYDVNENGSNAVITVCRSGDITGTNTIQYATADRTATNGMDYTATSGTLTFPPLMTDTNFLVAILDDKKHEDLKKVALQLSNPTGGAQLGALSNGVLRILDDDALTIVHFSQPVYVGTEGTNKVIVTVVRESDNTARECFVTWTATSGTASYGFQEEDAFINLNSPLDLQPDQLTDQLTVDCKPDQVTEPPEFFTVRITEALVDGWNAQVIAPSLASVIIIDPDFVPDSPSTTFTNNGTIVTATAKNGVIYTSKRSVTNGAPLRARAPRGAAQIDEVEDIILTGTDPATSSLTLKGKQAAGAGPIKIGTIISDGGLKSISAKGIAITESIVVNDYVASITIGDLADGASIVTGGTNTQSTKITAHVIGDGCTIQLGSAISSLAAARIGSSEIIAPSVGSVSLKGDKKVSILGDCLGHFTISGDLGKFSAGNAISNAVIDVNGNIGSVSALQIVNSTIKAGFTPDEPDAPFEGGTFVPGLSIGSVSTKGATDSFVNSLIAASSVGTVKLGSIKTDNGGTSFGVLANGSVDAVSSKTPAFKWDPSGASDQSVGDFHVKQ